MRLKQFVKKYIDPNLIVNVFVKVNNKYYKKVYNFLAIFKFVVYYYIGKIWEGSKYPYEKNGN